MAIQISQASDGWQVTGTPPPQIPPAGWDLLLRMIRTFLDMYRYAPAAPPPSSPPPPPPGEPIAALMIGTPRMPPTSQSTDLANAAGNPALAPLIEIALTVVTSMLAGCRTDADAVSATDSVSPRRRKLITVMVRANARRRGLSATDDEIAEAVDAVVSRSSAKQRAAFVRSARGGR